MKSKGTLRLHLIPPKSVRPAISEIRPKTTTATTTSSSSKINTQSKSTPFNSTSSKMLLKPIFEVTPFTDMFPYTHMITIHLPGVVSDVIFFPLDISLFYHVFSILLMRNTFIFLSSYWK